MALSDVGVEQLRCQLAARAADLLDRQAVAITIRDWGQVASLAETIRTTCEAIDVLRSARGEDD